MTVYLIHFERPIGNLSNPHGSAQHYLGSTDNLEERLKAHANGNGSKIMAEVTRQGIAWQVVRTWSGGRGKEMELKRQKNAPRLCPICREARKHGG